MSVISITDLYMDNVKMPEPLANGVVISKQNIWSGNKGTTMSGKLVGTILGVRTTIKIQWGNISPEDAAIIDAAVTKKRAVSLRYADPSGATITEQFLFDAPSYTWGRWIDGSAYLSSVTVSGESVNTR